MQRVLAAVVVWIGVGLSAGTAWAAHVCPFDPAALLVRACPCDGLESRVQYLKCVNRQVSGIRHLGCDASAISHCAAFSVCGFAPDTVVCCDRHGRPGILSTADCNASGGTAMPDAASICDASCPTHRHSHSHGLPGR